MRPGVDPESLQFWLGDEGTSFYVVESGEFEVIKHNAEDGTDNVVTKGGRGACVGELALLHDAPRAATIKVQICWLAIL